MKTILLLILLLSALATGAEITPSKYLQGTASRDVAGALDRAKKAGVYAVLFTYDGTNKKRSGPETENEYAFREFFDLPETKRLLATRFVQICAPWNAKGVAELRDPADVTGWPVAIFIGKDGAVITRVKMRANPADALHRVQEIIAGLK